MSNDTGTGFEHLKGMGAPARRALAAAGYTCLEELRHVTERELLQLHGMGPKAMLVLREALAERGLAFAPFDTSESAPAS